MENRRDLLTLGLAGGAAALVLAGCSAQQVADTEKKIADLIDQVQSGVVSACAIAGVIGKVVPSSNSVLAVLVSIVGTAIGGATGTMVAEAIKQIVALGCPSSAPESLTAAPRTTSSGAQVKFY